MLAEPAPAGTPLAAHAAGEVRVVSAAAARVVLQPAGVVRAGGLVVHLQREAGVALAAGVLLGLLFLDLGMDFRQALVFYCQCLVAGLERAVERLHVVQLAGDEARQLPWLRFWLLHQLKHLIL